MPSYFVKLCFALTALAPALGAAGLVAFFEYGKPYWAVAALAVAVVAICLNIGIVAWTIRCVSRKTFSIVDIKQADARSLEFLIVYLLPVFSGIGVSNMVGSMALTIYSLVLIAIVLIAGNILQFNPVLILWGYHTYVVTSGKGVEYVLISKTHFHSSQRRIIYVPLGEYLRIEVNECTK